MDKICIGIFGILIIVYLLVSCNINYFKEINASDYKWLKSDCNIYPCIISDVRIFYKDNKITKHEFDKIQTKIRKLRKIENERTIDSVKSVFSKELERK